LETRARRRPFFGDAAAATAKASYRNENRSNGDNGSGYKYFKRNILRDYFNFDRILYRYDVNNKIDPIKKLSRVPYFGSPSGFILIRKVALCLELLYVTLHEAMPSHLFAWRRLRIP